MLYKGEPGIGLYFPDDVNGMLWSKIGSPPARAAFVMGASKVRAEEAAGMGIIESVHSNGMETLEAAVRLGEDLSKKKWEGKVYAEIRKSLYPELCGILGLNDEKVLPSRL